MTKEELIQFLKDNLRIETETNPCSGNGWYNTNTCLSIKIMFGNEEITSSVVWLENE